MRQTKCLIEDCHKIGTHKGHCQMHHQRIKRHGDPNVGIKHRKKHPLYTTYCHMKARCFSKTDPDYYSYGGRGITVCDSWLDKDGFEAFCADLGEKPTPKHSLDRIDVNGNYEKSNCRWATTYQQASNTRKVGVHVGVRFDKERKKWCATLFFNKKNIHLGRFSIIEDAVAARKEAEKRFGIKI